MTSANDIKMAIGNRWCRFQDKDRNSRFFTGYTVEPQQTLPTGKRPDYIATLKTNPKQKAVADAKFVKELTLQNVKQVTGYKATTKAQKAAIFIPKKTRIQRVARQKAHDEGIKIIIKQARPQRIKAYA